MVAISGSRLLRVGFLTTACFAASSAERNDPNPDSVPQLVSAATSQMADGIAKMLAKADTSLGRNERSDTLTNYFAVPGASVPTSAATALERLERRLRASSDEISQWAAASAKGQATHAADAEDSSHHLSQEVQSLQHAIDRVHASAGARAAAAETKIAGLKGERDRLASELKTRDAAARSESLPSHEAAHLEDYLGWGKANHTSHQTQPVAHGAAAVEAGTNKNPAAVVPKAENRSNATTLKAVRVAKSQTTKREWPKELQPPAALRGGNPMSENLKNWLSGKPLVTPAPRVHHKPKVVATNLHLLAAKDILANLSNAVDVLGGHNPPANAHTQKFGARKPSMKEGEDYEGDPRLLAAEEMLGHTADGLPHHQHRAEDGSHHKHHHHHQQHHQHTRKKA